MFVLCLSWSPGWPTARWSPWARSATRMPRWWSQTRRGGDAINLNPQPRSPTRPADRGHSSDTLKYSGHSVWRKPLQEEHQSVQRFILIPKDFLKLFEFLIDSFVLLTLSSILIFLQEINRKKCIKSCLFLEYSFVDLYQRGIRRKNSWFDF